VNDVDALIGWLLEAQHGGWPVEDSGATALLSAISGTQVTAVMHARGPKQLTRQEQQLLEAPGTTTGHERRGVLNAGRVPAAAVTAVLLPHRVPVAALRALGIGTDGAVLADAGMPLGLALAGLGVRREPLEALATPGQRDVSGREQVIWSAARLWLDSPVAVVTECFYQGFLDAYPGPWTMPSLATRTAP
jgi:hypothetical protein